MNDELWRIVAKVAGFVAAISFGVAAKTVIESRKQKVYTRFIMVDLVTAGFVGYLILPYLDSTAWLLNWRGQVLAMTGYLGSWMLNAIIKFFKDRAGGIIGGNKNEIES
jgi:hypothetical protein